MALNKKTKKPLPLSSRFTIEHMVENSDGNLRPLRPEDLDMDNHPGVRSAFMMIYEWQKARSLDSRREKTDKGTNSKVDRG